MKRLLSNLLLNVALVLWFLFLVVGAIVAFVAVSVAATLALMWAVHLTAGLRPW